MSIADIQLSAYGRASSTPSPVSRMMSAFAADFRPDTDINLGVGYVNEETIPERLLLKAMQAVLDQPDKYKAALNYGGPEETYLTSVTPETAARHILAGHFSAGAMLPKVEAAMQFVDNGGRRAVITRIDRIVQAVDGHAGTCFVKD